MEAPPRAVIVKRVVPTPAFSSTETERQKRPAWGTRNVRAADPAPARPRVRLLVADRLTLQQLYTHWIPRPSWIQPSPDQHAARDAPGGPAVARWTRIESSYGIETSQYELEWMLGQAHRSSATELATAISNLANTQLIRAFPNWRILLAATLLPRLSRIRMPRWQYSDI